MCVGIPNGGDVSVLVFVLFLEGLLQPHTKMARAQCVTAYRKKSY